MYIGTWLNDRSCQCEGRLVAASLLAACFVLNHENDSVLVCPLQPLHAAWLLSSPGFPTSLHSMFAAPLKHFFCPYSVSMPILSCPRGNRFDNLLSAILFTRPTYWNWITISMAFPLVYWRCSGPSLMHIILPFNFKYSIQGELPRNWVAYQWQAWPELKEAESSAVCQALSSQLEFHGRNQNWSYHSHSLLFSLLVFFLYILILLSVTPFCPLSPYHPTGKKRDVKQTSKLSLLPVVPLSVFIQTAGALGSTILGEE